MQLFICHSNHFKFLQNIHKNILNVFASSLFCHTPLFTLAFHTILLLLFFSFLVQPFICNLNYIKFSHKFYNPFFNSFAYLLFFHTHSFTLAFNINLFLFYYYYCLVQLLICYPNHSKFLHNIHNYIFHFFAYSLFSSTHSFTLAFHTHIFLYNTCYLMQLLTSHSNHFKFLHKIYKYIFHIFAYLLFSHTHSFTLAHYIYFFLNFQSCSLVQLLTAYPYHFKFLHNIYNHIFNIFASLLFSHTHEFTLAFHITILLLLFYYLMQLLISYPIPFKIEYGFYNTL